MIKTRSLTICFVLVVSAISVTGQTGQLSQSSVDESILERQVPGASLEYLATKAAFHSTLGRTRTAGGMARIAGCEEDTFKQSWNPLNAPLRQVLDSIVEADPRFRWQVEEGVVNLLPASGEPPLLGVRISDFHVENVAEASDALSKLLALPEVKRRMSDLRLKHGLNIFVSPSQPRPKEFSVSCKGVTLREALNSIARAQGRAIWQYTEIRCDGKNEVIIKF